MISSTKNEQVKAVCELKKKAKARDEAGVFVVEGVRMAAELPAERVERIYVSEGFLENPANESLLARFPRYETVTGPVFAAMSDTQTPQGILAVVRQYEYGLAELLGAAGACGTGGNSAAACPARPGKGSLCGPAPAAHLMLLENIQDPGNLGTILRAGEGAGITGVIMSRDTVDIYNPKVIRSTMGSIFRVPYLYTDDLRETAGELKALGIRLFAAHLGGRNNYEEEDYTGNTGFLIGNEGNGLTDGLARKADAWVRIPMAGRVESLNAAVAASILMFETARQRRASEVKKELII